MGIDIHAVRIMSAEPGGYHLPGLMVTLVSYPLACGESLSEILNPSYRIDKLMNENNLLMQFVILQ